MDTEYSFCLWSDEKIPLRQAAISIHHCQFFCVTSVSLLFALVPLP
jgi:hypothetical protein